MIKRASLKKSNMKRNDGGHNYDPEFLKKLEQEEAKWESTVVKENLKIRAEHKDHFTTGSGEFTVKRLYSPLDNAGTSYSDDIGFPGQYPFTRGAEPLGFRARRLPVRFYSGFGSAQDANKRYHELIAAGANLISIAQDLPTQMGYDSDHPMAVSDVGKVGVAVNTLEDFERLFNDIPLEKIGIGLVCNATAPWIVAMLLALMGKRGIDPTKVRVHMQNDPLKEYAGRGTQILPVSAALDLAGDAVEYCCKHLPSWEPQFPCSTVFRWAGANASQEVGFGIANLMLYVEIALSKGIRPEVYLPKVHLHMSSDNDLFEEIAKFRATRRLWAKIAREKFQTDDSRILALRLTTFNNATRLTAQQPNNNIVRNAIQALAALLGGVERVDLPGHDEALALPTFESTWLARITSHLLIDENMIGNTVDPLGGSYYVETLTNKIEAEGREWYNRIEAMGKVAATEKGFYIRQISDGMYKYQQNIESGATVVIGVNKFCLDSEPSIKTFRPDPAVAKAQIERLNITKARRNKTNVENCLARIRTVSEAKKNGRNENIVPYVMEAVNAYASIGEIFNVFRQVFGEYRPLNII